MITPLERFRSVIGRGAFDRVPLEMSASPEMWNTLKTFLREDDVSKILLQVFRIDILDATPRSTAPIRQYADGTYDNLWGVRMKRQVYGDGKGAYNEAIGYPLADARSIDDVARHPWPSAEWYDYSGAVATMRRVPAYPFRTGYVAPGWWSWEMRGMSRFFEDLLAEPKIAEAVIQHVSDFCFDYYHRLIDAARERIGKNFCYIQIADDWASQDGLMISPHLFRRFFKRHYQRIIDLAHDAGLLVEFHCCGAVRELIPELIDMGVDILNPVQTGAAGMAPGELKRLYGNDLAFSGGVDVQTILPSGSVAQVKEYVKRLLDTLGSDGGYILGPTHLIQIGTPPENVVAMVQAVHEYYSQKNVVPPTGPGIGQGTVEVSWFSDPCGSS